MQIYLMRQRPIGIFDSGIGGLTVAAAIARRLPHERLIYFGDTAHLPYGDKSADAIRYYSLKIVKFLLEQDCKMVVIACNSASSTAFRVLLEFFQGQALFVNVVDPLVQYALEQGMKRVGIIATKATIHSGVYEEKLRAQASDMHIFSMATPLLVPMIEEGYVHNRISHAILEQYLSDPGFRDIQALLLACTHYPLIRREIEAYFSDRIQVWDSTDVAAVEVERQLAAADLLSDQREGRHHFYVSDYTESFEGATRLFYPEEIHLEHFPIW